ncbi:mercury(II) reductase [Sphingopyxis sp. SE2]|uniref:mercury(II) reductase n=1 Tax=Sphingopyxis sp. SE2 TaxID=1586240 RepID=UPI0028C30842|nr:mercury(II) reductase [Sphingopyxis sp. SE2]MDT7531207.1 mercury(II) reductase [Sphingopyxis sp. SE2]
MADHYDLVILGSGSTAFAAALKAQELGKTAVMTEHRTIGGTCVNRGCLPSKNLIEAAKLLHEARHPRYPGLSPCDMAMNFRELIGQKDEVVHGYRKKKYESLLGGRFGIEHGPVRFVDPHVVEVDGKRLSGDKMLVATGSHAFIPDIPGLADGPYLTSDLLSVDEAVELVEQPRSLLILGAGYIALELGQMFQRFGTPVTILERSEQVLAHGYEPEVGPAIARVLAEEGVQIVTGASVASVRYEEGEVAAITTLGGKQREFRAKRLLVATGRRPSTGEIGLDRADVAINDRGEVQVDRHLRTTVPHIFAAGDVIGVQIDSQPATPVGARQGGMAVHNALTDAPMQEFDGRVIPRTIFTDPQIATVGMTEVEAIAAGHRCWCSTIPMSLVPRAGAIRDTRGIIKMVADADTDEVLGVSMVGHNAGEVIHEAAMALRYRAKLPDFVDLLHVFPTMAEALKIVAISRTKDPAKLSCCAE